jgi:hypothetical protein
MCSSSKGRVDSMQSPWIMLALVALLSGALAVAQDCNIEEMMNEAALGCDAEFELWQVNGENPDKIPDLAQMKNDDDVVSCGLRFARALNESERVGEAKELMRQVRSVSGNASNDDLRDRAVFFALVYEASDTPADDLTKLGRGSEPSRKWAEAAKCQLKEQWAKRFADYKKDPWTDQGCPEAPPKLMRALELEDQQTDTQKRCELAVKIPATEPESLTQAQERLRILEEIEQLGVEITERRRQLTAWEAYFSALGRLNAEDPLDKRLATIAEAVTALNDAQLPVPQPTQDQQNRWQAEQRLVRALSATKPPFEDGTAVLREDLAQVDDDVKAGYQAALDLIDGFADCAATNADPQSTADACLIFLEADQWKQATDGPLLQTLAQRAKTHSKERIEVALDEIGQQLESAGSELAELEAQLTELQSYPDRLANTGIDANAVDGIRARLTAFTEIATTIQEVKRFQQGGLWQQAEAKRKGLDERYQNAWGLRDGLCSAALKEMKRLNNGTNDASLQAYRSRATVLPLEEFFRCVKSNEAFETFAIADQKRAFDVSMSDVYGDFKQYRFGEALERLEEWNSLPRTPDQTANLTRKRKILGDLIAQRSPTPEHLRYDKPEHRFPNEDQIIRAYLEQLSRTTSSTKPDTVLPPTPTPALANETAYQRQLSRAKNPAQKARIHLRWAKQDIKQQAASKDCADFKLATEAAALTKDTSLKGEAWAWFGNCRARQEKYEDALENWLIAGRIDSSLQNDMANTIAIQVRAGHISANHPNLNKGWHADFPKTPEIPVDESDLEIFNPLDESDEDAEPPAPNSIEALERAVAEEIPYFNAALTCFASDGLCNEPTAEFQPYVQIVTEIRRAGLSQPEERARIRSQVRDELDKVKRQSGSDGLSDKDKLKFLLAYLFAKRCQELDEIQSAIDQLKRTKEDVLLPSSMRSLLEAYIIELELF